MILRTPLGFPLTLILKSKRVLLQQTELQTKPTPPSLPHTRWQLHQHSKHPYLFNLQTRPSPVKHISAPAWDTELEVTTTPRRRCSQLMIPPSPQVLISTMMITPHYVDHHTGAKRRQNIDTVMIRRGYGRRRIDKHGADWRTG